MLTQKQKELLLFIHAHMQDNGIPPSFDEMKTALDLKSKSGIHRLIMALEERGFIRRLPHRARALEVLKLPDAVGPDAASAASTANSAARTGANPTPADVPPAHIAAQLAQAPVTVPLMGRIAAGVPISAIQDHTDDIACPPDMLSTGEHFALTVNGDSMIEAGIHDGDIAVIKRCDTATNGEIVVALVAGEEATLKTIRKRGSTVALEAANPQYETRIFGPDQIQIQGKLVALMRKY